MRKFQIKYIIFAIIIIIFTVLFDQMTKNWAMYSLNMSIPVTFFLSFTLSFNKGISFGLFNSSQTDQVILVIVALSIVLGLSLTINRSIFIPYSLIIGGAIGNIIDRLRVSAVIDFINLHYKNYHFPIFNIADIAICLGCGVLLFAELLQSRKNQPDSKGT